MVEDTYYYFYNNEGPRSDIVSERRGKTCVRRYVLVNLIYFLD